MIEDKNISQTLTRLHKSSRKDLPNIMKGLAKGVFRKLKPEDMKNAYIAMTEEQGMFMYDTIIKNNSRHIVEFGTSFGISTLYLAAAARKTNGKVITTEILPNKCKKAGQNFEEAKALDVIELREGDALETLKDVEKGIDFLLLDGWNDLYLPLLKILEPKFQKNCIIVTDNANFSGAKPFLNHVRQSKHYTSQNLKLEGGRTEYTIYLGN